jgi:hypothetical protein
MQNAMSYLQNLSMYLHWSRFICAFVRLSVSLHCDNILYLLCHNNPGLDIHYFYMSLIAIQFSNQTIIKWGFIDGYLAHLLFNVTLCWEMWTVIHIPIVLSLQFCSVDSQRLVTSMISITPCYNIMMSYALLTLRNSCTIL